MPLSTQSLEGPNQYYPLHKGMHMLKDLVSKLDYSDFDEIALVLFGVCFLAIVWGTTRLKQEAAMRFSNIPIEDTIVDPWDRDPVQGDMR
jgi:cytochrome c oxidase cbb3-type subunit IV